MILRSTLVIGAAGLLTAGASVATASVTHDTVAPPGVGGCAQQPEVNAASPGGRLAASGDYRAQTGLVGLRLLGSTQATKATIRATYAGGRRADTQQPNDYTCTRAARTLRLAFGVDRRAFGTRLRRDGHVRLRVTLRMVNASGKRTTVRRTVDVRRRA